MLFIDIDIMTFRKGILDLLILLRAGPRVDQELGDVDQVQVFCYGNQQSCTSLMLQLRLGYGYAIQYLT